MKSAFALLLTLATGGAAHAVPYVPSPEEVTGVMLNLAEVGPSDYVIDLGSGDGRIVIGAALRGARAFGVDINAELVARSRDNARRAGVADRATFAVQDLFTTDFSEATVVTMYLLPQVNLDLRPTILAMKPGTRVVSHDWGMGEWSPDRSVAVDAIRNPQGYEKSSMVYFWTVPARIDGRWCTPLGAMKVGQAFQKVDLALERLTIKGEMRGAELVVVSRGSKTGLRATLADGALTVWAATGAFAPLAGASLRRIAPSERCPAR